MTQMTRAAAAELLGVPVNASADDVRRRYEDLYNEFSVRLTNAPTPALKETWQKNLREMQAAAEALAPGLLSAAQEWPAAEPVGNAPRTRTSQPQPPRSSTPVTPPDDGSWPRSTIVAAAVAVVAVAALSLFVMLWAKERARAAGAAQQMLLDAQKVQELEARARGLEQALKPGFLDVCNRSAKALRIEAVVSVFVDSQGKLRTIHSGSYNYPTWDVGPGERKRLSVLRGTSDDWDGTSAIYALQVAYPGKEPFLVAGLLSEAKDNCANLYLD